MNIVKAIQRAGREMRAEGEAPAGASGAPDREEQPAAAPTS
jgi:hypothetical protein